MPWRTDPVPSTTKPSVLVALSGPTTDTSVASAPDFSRIPSLLGWVGSRVSPVTEDSALFR